jgi:hypothetical protein
LHSQTTIKKGGATAIHPPPPKPAGELEGHKRFKISLEVAALDDLAPLTVALDGDATILSPATADELVVDVGHHDA